MRKICLTLLCFLQCFPIHWKPGEYLFKINLCIIPSSLYDNFLSHIFTLKWDVLILSIGSQMNFEESWQFDFFCSGHLIGNQCHGKILLEMRIQDIWTDYILNFFWNIHSILTVPVVWARSENRWNNLIFNFKVKYLIFGIIYWEIFERSCIFFFFWVSIVVLRRLSFLLKHVVFIFWCMWRFSKMRHTDKTLKVFNFENFNPHLNSLLDLILLEVSSENISPLRYLFEHFQFLLA